MNDAVDTRGAYDSLFSLYVPIAVAVLAAIALTLVFVGVRFRAARHPEPSRRLTNRKLEIAYAAALAAIATVLLWRTYSEVSRVNPVVARAAPAPGAGAAGLTVGIVASRWNWRFTYPGGVAQTGDGDRRTAVLVVPEGQPVRFRLTSRDVAHAFWVPALDAKYDAIPGRTNVFDLQFARGRDYSTSRCSEFCGEFHDQMLFRVDVRPPAAFGAWLRARQAARTA